MEKAVVLIGAAADSYVQLQWVKFYCEIVFLITLFVFVGYAGYKLLAMFKKDFS